MISINKSNATNANSAFAMRIRRLTLMVIVCLLLAYFAFEVFYVFDDVVPIHLYDLGFFYYAFHTVWTHHAKGLIYNATQQRIWMNHYLINRPVIPHDQYLYPPQFAFVWSWLAAFPVRTVNIIWPTLSILGYAASFCLLLKIYVDQISMGKFTIFLALMVPFAPFLSDLSSGNSDWLILFLLVLTLYLHDSQRHFAKGIPLGFAIVFKLTPILILFYFLLRRQWKGAMSTVATILVVSLSTVAAMGWHPIWTFLSSFEKMSAAVLIRRPAPWNSSLRGILELVHVSKTGYLTSGQMNDIFDVYLVVMVAIGAWLLLCRQLESRAEFAFVALNMLLLSPVVEAHHMLFSLLAIFAVWNTYLKMLRSKTWTDKRLRYTLGIISLLMAVCIVASPQGLFLAVFHSVSKVLWPLTTLSYFIQLMLLMLSYTLMSSSRSSQSFFNVGKGGVGDVGRSAR